MSLNDLMYFNFLVEGFRVSDQAVKSTDSDTYYYGYVNNAGEWYILQQDTTAGSNGLQTYRFIKGQSGYTTAWSAREAATYDYFYNIFNVNNI